MKGIKSATRFNPTSNHPMRAVQAWQILVGAAMRRQTLTYKSLSELMYQKEAAGVLDKILGHIAFYCQDHDLPTLTVIVVNQTTGAPGQDIPLSPEKANEEREKVFAEDWYDLHPPSAEALAAAYAARP